MKSNSRTANTFRNSFWGIASKVLGMICPFFFRAIIIRKLGYEYVGLEGFFISILNVLNMSELGFASAVTFMMYKPIVEKDVHTLRSLLNTIRKLYRFIGLFVLLAGCSLYPFLNVLVKNDTGADVNLYVLYSMYLFNVVVSYLSSAYRSTLFTAHQRNDLVSKILLITEVLRFSIQGLILYLTSNYYLYLFVFAVSVIPQNYLYYYYSKRMYPDIYCEGNITEEQKNEIKSKVLPLLCHRIGGTVIVSIDDLVISAFLGITVLTQYDNYYFIFHSVTTLLTVLRNGVIASLGNKIYSSSKDDLYKTYLKVYFVWIIVVGWCTCFFSGLYQPFIRMWVGEQFVYQNRIMLIICLYFFLWQFRNIGVTMKEAAGLWEPDKYKPILGMVLNAGLSILAVIKSGSVLGVLIPTMCIMVVLYFPWETHVLFKYIFKRSCKDYLLLTGRLFLSVVIAVAASYITARAVPDAGILYFLLRIIICMIVPGGVFCLINYKTTEFSAVVSDVKAMYSIIVKGE